MITKRYIKLAQKAAAVFLIASLTACAVPDRQASRSEFPVALAQDTLETGYRQISQRFIENVSVRDLALEGLRGLSTIEPSLHIEEYADEILLQSSYIGTRRYNAPFPEDSDAWARLTVRALMDLRARSPEFRAADSEKLYEAVFDGSLSLLDKFSRYASAKQATENRAKRSGFGGIGIQFFTFQTGFRVSSVFANTPAARAGLRKGDIITHINGRQVVGVSRKLVRNWLRGTIGSLVNLKILRSSEDQVLAFTVKRDRIVLPTVARSIKDGIIFLKITGFNNRTSRQVFKKYSEGKRILGDKVKGVILDLRGNPGGLLRQAIKVADLFLTKGHILSTRGRHPASKHDYEAKSTDIALGLPVAILINSRSASASEIVAAALQDHERAAVIGSSSFGKGSVQTVARLPNDGEITLTWSRFVTPSGYIPDELGVPPNICTTSSSSAAKSGTDSIIESALRTSAAHDVKNRAWKSIHVTDKEGRRRLKNSCPGNKSQGERDIIIAERILKDPSLYQRVMALNTSLASAPISR